MALQTVATVQLVWIQEVINSYATDRKAQTLEHLQEFPIAGCHSFFFWQKQKKPSPTVPHPRLPFLPSSEK
jgi:hypothetical protein